MGLFRKKKPPELPPELKEELTQESMEEGDLLSKLEQETASLGKPSASKPPASSRPPMPTQPPQGAPFQSPHSAPSQQPKPAMLPRTPIQPPQKPMAEEMPMPSHMAKPTAPQNPLLQPKPMAKSVDPTKPSAPTQLPKPSMPTPAPQPPVAKAPEKEEPEEKPSLSKQQIARLPLFMKVEEYDKIVGELTVLVDSLKNMEKIMNKLSALEEEEGEEAKRWKEQLNRTKQQVRVLLEGMPETGDLQDALKEKAKLRKREQIKKDVEKLSDQKKTKKSKPVVPASHNPEVHHEVGELKDSLKNLKDEMRNLHLEFKMLNSLSQIKGAKASTDLVGKQAPPTPKPVQKKMNTPWEE